MKKPVPAESASAFIDAKIDELADWRGKTLAKLRAIVHAADPQIVEEWKWVKPTSPGTPVWSRGGIVCTGETYRNAVKMTFARGAVLPDPAGLFNSSLEGNVRRAIDIHEGDKIDAVALKDCIKTKPAHLRQGASNSVHWGPPLHWVRQELSCLARAVIFGTQSGFICNRDNARLLLIAPAPEPKHVFRRICKRQREILGRDRSVRRTNDTNSFPHTRLITGGTVMKTQIKILPCRAFHENVYIFVLLLLCVLLAPLALFGQSGAGSIQGTVTDATGAVISGASIRVVNAGTGVVSTTTSNRVGFYQVPELFTATYKVTVSTPGMKTYTTSVELQVAQNAVINPVLTAGSVTQQITVNADTVQLTTQDSGTIGSTLENQRINQLPMNGRNILSLVGESTPGLEDNGQKMDGQAIEALDYLVDGTSTQNNLFGGQNKDDNGQSGNAPTGGSTPPVQLLDADSIQEVKVQGANSSAQYEAPATVLLTTKSGTNALHGTFFETARNNAFGLARRRQDPVNFAAPHLVRNEFGASAGGPIVLPHIYHGKDKSFWFFSFERYSLAELTSSLVAVPTDAMRTGNFSGLFTRSGLLQTLYDPATTHSSPNCAVPHSSTTTKNPYCRTAFAGNVIPSSEISPIAKLYAKLIPAPTTPDNPLIKGNLTVEEPTYQVIPQFTFRLDHNFNENNRAYLRFTENNSNTNITSGGLVNLPLNSGGVNIPFGAAFGWSNSPLTSFLAESRWCCCYSRHWLC